MSTVTEARSSSLERAHLLLSAFDERHQVLSLSELARRSGLPKTTVHRMIRQLVDLGWLSPDGGSYTIGTAVFQFGTMVPVRAQLCEVAQPYLQDLYEATHATIHLAVHDGGQVLYAEKISGRRSVNVLTRIGGHMPLHCTGVGKALLAFAPQALVSTVLSQPLPGQTPFTITTPTRLVKELAHVRTERLAYDREEAALGLRCVAAPIITPGGTAVAAVSVSVPASRSVDPVRPAVLMTARNVSRALAAR